MPNYMHRPTMRETNCMHSFRYFIWSILEFGAMLTNFISFSISSGFFYVLGQSHIVGKFARSCDIRVTVPNALRTKSSLQQQRNHTCIYYSVGSTTERRENKANNTVVMMRWMHIFAFCILHRSNRLLSVFLKTIFILRLGFIFLFVLFLCSLEDFVLFIVESLASDRLREIIVWF